MINIGEILGQDTVLDVIEKITVYNLKESYKMNLENLDIADNAEDIQDSQELLEALNKVIRYYSTQAEYDKWLSSYRTSEIKAIKYINEFEMEYGDKPKFTLGETYIVYLGNYNDFHVIDDEGSKHWFDFEIDEDGWDFRDYFEVIYE